jgi:hypothetical protein
MILFSQSRPTLDFIELLLQDDWGRMLGGAPYEPNAELRKRETLCSKVGRATTRAIAESTV